MDKAQVGDLITVVSKHDVVTAFRLGGIYEVTGLSTDSQQPPVIIAGEEGVAGYIDHDEYVIHRKVGEEDAINPQHYKQGRVEVIDIIEDAVQGADPFEAVLQANIIKYTHRYRNKNGGEDLKKAQWYLNKLVSYLENK